MNGYKILKLEHGGYVVTPCNPQEIERGFYVMATYACTQIHEALEYIRKNLEPIK